VQAKRQMKKKSRLPNVVTPHLRDKVNLKHLYQVRHSSTLVLSLDITDCMPDYLVDYDHSAKGSSTSVEINIIGYRGLVLPY
jgi:hypothetical protein